MKRLTIFATLILTCPAWGLDLTPNHGFRRLEGFKIPVLEFHDAGKKLNYQPPADWRISGGGAVLELHAPGAGQSSMKLMVMAKRPGARAELSSELVLAFARELFPKRATNLMLEKESPTPFTLEGKPSLESTFSFILDSSREMMSVAVVDRSETEWFVAMVSASADRFEAVHAQAISSLFTWRIAAVTP